MCFLTLQLPQGFPFSFSSISMRVHSGLQKRSSPYEPVINTFVVVGAKAFRLPCGGGLQYRSEAPLSFHEICSFSHHFMLFFQRRKSKRETSTTGPYQQQPTNSGRSTESSSAPFSAPTSSFSLSVLLSSFNQPLPPSKAPELRPPRSDDVQISPHSSVSARRWRLYRTNSLKHASSCSPRLWCACLSSALAQFQLVRSWVRCWRGPGEGPVGLYQVHLLL